MVKKSYCAIHNIFPKENEPCRRCVNIHEMRAYTEGFIAGLKTLSPLMQDLQAELNTREEKEFFQLLGEPTNA